MSDQWTDRLSEYLDGELDERERAALDAHLTGCAACATTLGELRRVVGRARALDDRPPATDLWPGIATRIGSSIGDLARRRARRRVSFTVPQLIAAGLAMLAVSAGGVWIAVHRPATSIARAPAPRRVSPAAPASWPAKVDSSADRALTELQDALTEGRRTGRLDSLTVRTLEHSLAVIDTAITEARRALTADPQSAYLNHHLADTMRRKLELLRQANRIAAART